MKLAKLNSRNRRAGPKPPPDPIRLDLGSGPNGKPGFLHVDSIAFPGVEVVLNLAEPLYKELPDKFKGLEEYVERKVIGYRRWPWKDDSVEEVHSSHCLEHFTAMERVHFMNELWRVLKVGAKATTITPHWASCRAYGDPTHKFPAICEFYWFYLKKEWRMSQAPHTDTSNLWWGLKCNFDVTGGYSLEPRIAARNQEYQEHAMSFFKEACQDTWATLTKLP